MKLFSLVFMGFFSLAIMAQNADQQVIASAGGHYEDSEIQVSWTLGETVISTIESTDYTLTQGFHQPTYTVTEIKEKSHENFNVKVFPNPSTDIINISVTDQDINALEINLMSVEGKSLINQDILGTAGTIDLSGIAPGSYMISVKEQDGNMIKTFVIIKE